MTKTENIVSFPDLKIIEAEAAAWVARMDSRASPTGEYSHSQASFQADFQNWVGQSPQHREAFARMGSLWGGCDILDELNYMDYDMQDAPDEQGRKRRYIWALAASVMLAFATIFYQTSGFFDQTQTEIFMTAVGEQKVIALVDGSQVILNTNSEIEVDITEERRQITLIRGEGFFEVASDRNRPFKVYAGDGVVKAVGTAFTVYLKDKAVEVTVTEGVVELLTQKEARSNAKPGELLNFETPKLTTVAALTAGQNAVFTEKIERLARMSDAEVDRKLLWREGFISFAGEPLSKVVADISRYTDIIIEIDDPALEDTPIGGHFRVGDVAAMFEALENIFGVEVEYIDAARVKLSRAL